MITIKPITQFPRELFGDLNDFSRKEVEAAGEDAETVFGKSFKAWLLIEDGKFLGLCGAIRPEAADSHACLWMLTSVYFTARHAKQMRFVNETIRELLGEPMLAMATDEARAKFLDFIGFTRVAALADGSTIYRMN